MANDPSKVTVPSITPEEVVQAASGLAAYAKRRFLEGFADEAADLADRAASVAAKVDTAAQAALKDFAARLRAHAPAPAPAPAAPAAGGAAQ